MRSKVILIIAAVLLIISFALAYIVLYPRQYFNDRLLIYYQNEVGESQAIVLDLDSYNILPLYYGKQYHVIMFNGEKTIENRYIFYSYQNAIMPGGFLKTYKNENNYNLQDENYQIAFTVNGQNYAINLQHLAGDFLINNTLERLTYVNLGEAELMIDNKKYPAKFALTKTLSYNIDKATIGDGTTGSGHNIFLTDQANNLYLFDKTDITASAGAYISHSWFLYKNSNQLQKNVTAGNFALVSNSDQALQLSVPDLTNANIILNKISNNANKHDTYYLFKGNLVDDNGERLIGGVGMKYEY